jgi:hypothetical protein
VEIVFHFKNHFENGKIKKAMKNNVLLINSFWACDLQLIFYRRIRMNKKFSIFLISFVLIFISIFFLYPIPFLLGHFPAPWTVAQQSKIILPEPIIMLLVGSGLFAMGIFVRRKFKKNL